MFCPCCNNFLTESSLIKKNAKYTSDGLVAVEYDVRCPDCSEEIGKMSWGRFIPKPDIAPYSSNNGDEPGNIQDSLIPPPPPSKRYGKETKGIDTHGGGPVTNTPEEFAKEDSADMPDDSAPYAGDENPETGFDGDSPQTVKYCPHCGLPLPDEY